MVKKLIHVCILLVLLAALFVGGYFYYEHEKNYPSTDDAYIQANVVNVAPQVSGKVSAIFVQNNQFIKKGQPLFNIDQKPFQVTLRKAEANLANTMQQVKAEEAGIAAAKALVAERQAELANTIKTSVRVMTLVKRNLYAIAAGDKATRNLKVAQATMKAAKSQLAEAKQKLGKTGEANAEIRAAKAAVTQATINLQYTKIISPTDGHIAKFLLRRGSEVVAYQEVFSIIDNQQFWVSANFKETDLQRIRVGQKARIKVDIYPEHIFKGVVKSISPGSGSSFALLPPEEASGNWVKVTQRFSVRVRILNLDSRYPLRIGASCSVTIDTTGLNTTPTPPKRFKKENHIKK